MENSRQAQPKRVISGPSIGYICSVIQNPKLLQQYAYPVPVKDINNVECLSDLVQCPYDSLHQVRFSRYHQHLIKCKKNHPEVEKTPCFYNAAELVNTDTLITHHKECPQKEYLEWTDHNENQHNVCKDKCYDIVTKLAKNMTISDNNDINYQLSSDDDDCSDKGLTDSEYLASDSNFYATDDNTELAELKTEHCISEYSDSNFYATNFKEAEHNDSLNTHSAILDVVRVGIGRGASLKNSINNDSLNAHLAIPDDVGRVGFGRGASLNNSINNDSLNTHSAIADDVVRVGIGRGALLKNSINSRKEPTYSRGAALMSTSSSSRGPTYGRGRGLYFNDY